MKTSEIFSVRLRRCSNVPLATINKWHKEGTGPPGYPMHKESHYRRGDVSRWLAEQRDNAGGLPKRVRKDLHADAFNTMPEPLNR
jgi:hypothetical protein